LLLYTYYTLPERLIYYNVQRRTTGTSEKILFFFFLTTNRIQLRQFHTYLTIYFNNIYI